MIVPMRIYIDREGEPVRQPSETEAERMGFRQIEVTPAEVAVASLAAQRQFHHTTLDERDRLRAALRKLAEVPVCRNEAVQLALLEVAEIAREALGPHWRESS